MEQGNELLANLTSLSNLMEYLKNHEWQTIFMAIGFLILPFVLKALIKILWSIFTLIVQFIFKDRLKVYMRDKICSLLHYYVAPNLNVEEMPMYQSNMVTLYDVHWTDNRTDVKVNRAEIRIDLGSTARRYFKLWLRSLFKTIAYQQERIKLLADCIKEIRLYRAEAEVILQPNVPALQAGISSKSLEATEQQVLDECGKYLDLPLNLAFESSKVVLKAGKEEFCFQNCFGQAMNVCRPDGNRYSLRLGCMYEGQNLTLNSTDDNLEKFLLTAGDLYLSEKIWYLINTFGGYIPRELRVDSGKLADIRLTLQRQGNRIRIDRFNAKLEEGKFAYQEVKVAGLEMAVSSIDWRKFFLDKILFTVNDRFVGLTGNLNLENTGEEVYSFNVRLTETSWVFGKDVKVSLPGGLELHGEVQRMPESYSLDLTSSKGGVLLDLPEVQKQLLEKIHVNLRLDKGLLLGDVVSCLLNGAPVQFKDLWLNLGTMDYGIELQALQVHTDKIMAVSTLTSKVLSCDLNVNATIKGNLRSRNFTAEGSYVAEKLPLGENTHLEGKFTYDHGFVFEENFVSRPEKRFHLPVVWENGKMQLKLPDIEVFGCKLSDLKLLDDLKLPDIDLSDVKLPNVELNGLGKLLFGKLRGKK